MNNNLPPTHPDFARAMEGRALLPPTRPGIFDHLANSDASAVGSYRMGGRYAAAAAAGLGLANPLLPSLSSLSQELRRYGPMMLGGFGGGLGIGVGQHHQLQTSLLLEEKLLRLRHEQNRYLEEERAYIALRDQLGAQQQQQAAQ